MHEVLSGALFVGVLLLAEAGAVAPILQVEEMGWGMRLIVSVVGGLASYFALFFRPPQTAKEGATRAGIGALAVFSCTGKALEWVGWQPTLNNALIMAFGIGLGAFMIIRVVYDVVEKWLPGALQSKLSQAMGSTPREEAKP